MMDMRKLSLVLLLVGITALTTVETGFAASLAPTEGIAAQGNNGQGCAIPQSANTLFSTNTTSYIKYGHCFIAKNSSTQVKVSGDTEAISMVDSIGVDLYLQQWNSSAGQWADVAFVGSFHTSNATYIAGSADVNVPTGYYYRTRAEHWIIESGTKQQSDCYSSYILVN